MRRRRQTLGALLGVGMWLACLISPQPGLAKISCQQNAEEGVLSISVTGETYAGVRRSGDAIAVFDVISGKRGCETGATVINTDRIKLFAAREASVSIELKKGPFAPGLSADEDAFPEIELEASGPGFVEVIGGAGPEHFQFMDEGSESGVNLNPDEDEDLDVVVSRKWRIKMLFVVNGGAGADRIDAAGKPALEMFATGGDGNDILLAAPTGAILDGERGNDQLLGSGAFDFLVPGRGADRIVAKGGSDLIEMKPDGSRDRIDCGPGRDAVARGDKFDRLRSC
jgi:hypothetical protein